MFKQMTKTNETSEALKKTFQSQIKELKEELTASNAKNKQVFDELNASNQELLDLTNKLKECSQNYQELKA